LILRNLLDELSYSWQRVSQPLRFSRLKAPSEGWPILLGISFPKSGTNLLSQILASFCSVAPFSDRSFDVFATFANKTGERAAAEAALDFLGHRRPLDVVSAHFLTWPELVTQVQQSIYLPFFIYRDPRDVVVSHVFYVTDRATEHVHHDYYANVLTNFDDRLRTSILGRPELHDIEFPDIGRRFAPYLGWTRTEGVLALKFEQLIDDRRRVLSQIADHFLQRVPTVTAPRDTLIDIIEASIAPEKSRTFRVGRTGEWKKYFKDEHKRLFKQVAGEMLVNLGYEKDLDW
jgi:hypothetical protein